jgi:DNA-binding GntR family transcriptional regulator
MSDVKGEESRGEDGANRLHVSLREMILLGSLAAGTAVAVTALVRRHRVSKASAQEVLSRLEGEGLVTRETSDEAVVTDPARGPWSDITRLAERWLKRTKDPDAVSGSDFP